MKKLAFLLGFVLTAAFVLADFSADARHLSITEKFTNENSTDEGDTGAYSFDKAHSSIGFRVKHMGLVEVPGYFRDFTGTVNYAPQDVTKSTVEFTAKAASVDTGVAPRDNHLRTKDFFEVETYPDITFKSTKIEKKGKGLMLTGDLTMKGVTKSISFPFNVAGFLKDAKSGASKMGATAETVINRRDFGVNYGGNLPNGAPMLSDNITIILNIEANTTPAKPEAK
ncbi:MAG TPA: YceI family protein [Pyrinomonadaceae bacterium]|jgi:polyisoprenoid-binding protein YceI